MIDLERSLTELADRLEIPGGDELANAVVRRIAAPIPHPVLSRRVPPRRRLAVALAFAASLAVVIVALPGPRRAIARWLGFDSVHIEPGVTVPTTAAQPTMPSSSSSTPTAATPTTGPPDLGLGLGASVSMTDAMARTGLPDPTPELLGEPQSIHVVQPPEAGQIMLVYAASDLVPESPVTGVGALVSVMPALIDEGYFGKMLGSATVRAVDVDGAHGFWIEGAPHQVFFESDGQVESDTLRLATNTLLWERGDVTYRIEAEIPLETALRIAASI